MNEALTPLCPHCGEPPLWVFDDGHQCFCGNTKCDVDIEHLATQRTESAS